MNELRELNKFKRIHDNNHQDSECYMLSIGDRAMIKQDFSLLAELLIVLPRMAVGPRREVQHSLCVCGIRSPTNT